MQSQDDIIHCYNKTAKNYADYYFDELSKKHFDRIILQSFAHENATNGRLIDLDCGPRQTTKFLSKCNVTNIIGTDISPEMVRIAGTNNLHITFEMADVLLLQYTNNSFGSVVAFYAIVHFTYDQVRTVFREINMVLQDKGQFLFPFISAIQWFILISFLTMP